MMGIPLKCDGKKLIYDEACLHIKNMAYNMEILAQSVNCYKCSLEPFLRINAYDVKQIVVKTTYGTILQFPFNNSVYMNTYFFEQHGHYGLNISNSGISDLFEITKPNDANEPLQYFLWTLIVALVIWTFGSYIFTQTTLFSRIFQPRLIINEAENDLGAISSRPGENIPLIPELCRTRRIQSLDVFRGITIVLMLFVNYGGGKYWMFEHSTWNGLTIADLVFPWFAWIMGNSLILSINGQWRNSLTRRKIFIKILLRSLALCAIGVILNSIKNNNITTLRFPGVLQRLGLSYLIVGSIETVFITTQNRYNIGRPIKKIQDWIYNWPQWIIISILIGVYCFISFCITVPGCPKGYTGPGGLHMNGSFLNCTGGIAGYIDRRVFSNQHLYNFTSLNAVYHNQLPYDPEGLLGTLTTALTVFLGVHAGRILLCYTNPKGRILRWLLMAVLTGAIGGHLCGWSKENGIVPLNKSLWSISFALCTSCLAFTFKSLLFIIIDCKGWWSGSPFQQVGKNAIFIYIGSVLTKVAIPWNWTPIDYSTHAQILWMNVWSTFLWILISIVLDIWNIHITI